MPMYDEDLNYIPVLPSRNTVIFPKMIFPMYIGREMSIASLEKAVTNGGKVLIIAQKTFDIESPKAKDLYKVGVVAKILQVLKLQSSNIKVLMEGVERVKITKLDIEKNSINALYKPLPDKENKKTQLDCDALKRSLIEHFQDYVKASRKLNNDVIASITNIKQASTLCDAICSHMNLPVDKKQSLLENTNVYSKMEELLCSIQTEIEFLDAENRIKNNVKTQIEKNQREYYLNEQLKAIYKELGDTDNKDDLNNLSHKISSAKLPKEAKKQAEAELRKLKSANPSSSEAGVSRTYLECLLDMPWNKHSKLKSEISEAEKILDSQHFGLDKVKERIAEYLSVGIKTSQAQGEVLCLVGPPGVGKTSLAKSIAEATGRKYAKISLGGVKDEAELRGHRRTYIGAMPGKIISALKKTQTSNPVILLDEVDKIQQEYRGDPTAALLEILDPEQNHAFNDHYLEVDFDLSKVMFICTANSLNMPKPLLDRLEIINLSGYTEREKLEIAQKYLVDKQRKAHGLKLSEFTIDQDALKEIIRYYTREAGVRDLNRNIAKMMRKTVHSIVTKALKTAHVLKSDVSKLLGVRKILHGNTMPQPTVGVSNGLAYTSVGGDILNIEVAIAPGKGEIKTTGTLGDVMKESVFAAMTYIKSQHKIFKIDPQIFSTNDIHLHVPEGAVPKDGPSAGIAIFTAILSAVTQRPVRSDIAMTGEITLVGKVLAIGGLKEKLLAAVASGIKEAFIPKDNAKDIAELPKDITDHITITTIEQASELVDRVLIFNTDTSPEILSHTPQLVHDQQPTRDHDVITTSTVVDCKTA